MMPSQQSQAVNSDFELKHLGFLRLIAINTLLCISSLYESAKLNSGPFKSTVSSVETAATSITLPLYNNFKDVPHKFLVFMDNLVDGAIHKFNDHAPPVAKKIVNQANCLFRESFKIGENMVNEVKTGGPVAAVHYAGALYKQWVPIYVAKAWYGLNKIPVFVPVGELVLPLVTKLSNNYNSVISCMTAKGYPLISHVPLVPVDKIAKAYQNQVEPSTGSSSSGSGSDTD